MLSWKLTNNEGELEQSYRIIMHDIVLGQPMNSPLYIIITSESNLLCVSNLHCKINVLLQ